MKMHALTYTLKCSTQVSATHSATSTALNTLNKQAYTGCSMVQPVAPPTAGWAAAPWCHGSLLTLL